MLLLVEVNVQRHVLPRAFSSNSSNVRSNNTSWALVAGMQYGVDAAGAIAWLVVLVLR